MDLPSQSHAADQELLRLAHQLRRAATDAGRPDVLARVDEVIALIPAGEGTGKTDNSVADPVIRFMDGLGL